jgi:hypothetical protein
MLAIEAATVLTGSGWLRCTTKVIILQEKLTLI